MKIPPAFQPIKFLCVNYLINDMTCHMSFKFLKKMTLPSNSRSYSNNDMDVNSLMNNREFQEILQDYFQSNTMTLDEFMENLPRFMMETYGNDHNYENGSDEEEEEAYDDDEEEDLDDNDAFLAFLNRSSQSGFRSEPVDASSILFRSLLAGRREAREIPLRNILPQSPPPSPVPNIVNTAASIPFFQRNGIAPPVPSRPGGLRRVPSQLRTSTTNSAAVRFDPNVPEECKSPYNSPIDRNNELPLTSEFMRRYGHDRISLAHNNLPALVDDDQPER